MSTEYYKGYTQHLECSSKSFRDPGAILTNNMVPGLFLMKHLGQEGYSLPVCRYINNFRSDVIGEMPITIDGNSKHPRYDYATINKDKEVHLLNLEEPAATLKGGIVVITNIMPDRRFGHYSLEDGNFAQLLAGNVINVLYVVKDNENEGLILKINGPCLFTAGDALYEFDLVRKGEVYVDFIASMRHK